MKSSVLFFNADIRSIIYNIQTIPLIDSTCVLFAASYK